MDKPAMTIVFNLKDQSMVDNVNAGDKVRFKDVNHIGTMVVSQIQAAH